MKIINLTQHPATSEQIEAGVIDMEGESLLAIRSLLTFESLPDRREIDSTVQGLADIAAMYDIGQDEEVEIYPAHAMIGGAPWLMPALEAALLDRFITPVYAFSARESVEQAHDDGSVRKVTIFRHVGFVPAK
jgi:hypothetical protein